MKLTSDIPIAAVVLSIALFGSAPCRADEADAFFGAEQVHEIRLYFNDSNWYQKLLTSHANDPKDPYFPARFVYGDLVLDPIGVRFKGNSSFSAKGVKKSFKLDFNEYQEGAGPGVADFAFFGLDKLNLNNGFKDPTLLREHLFLEFTRRYVPALRSTFACVYVNDQAWGVFSAVEQIDETFIRSRFGRGKGGNLFEGERSDAIGAGGTFGSDLTYRGPDLASYYPRYQLKTNESVNDWSDLVGFIDVLNNTPAAQLPGALEPVADVENLLLGMALNVLFANLDSYSGSAHNYYLYDRSDTGRFTHLHWDLNETFGTFRFGLAAGETPLTLKPLWLPSSTGQARPLMEKLWAVSSYRRFYLRALARMLREGFDEVSFRARVNALADRIRPHVQADPNYLFTPAEFEGNLANQIGSGAQPTYGLVQFVRERAASLRQALNALAEVSDLQFSEVASASPGDSAGWLELENLGPGRVNLSGFYLTDETANPSKWPLPAGALADGEFLVIRMDGETARGADHASFALRPGGGAVYLYHISGATTRLIDSVTYPPLAANQSYAGTRTVSGVQWAVSILPTAGQANVIVPPVTLYINEFLADNHNWNPDPANPLEFDDWIEIYNPGPAAVDMGGMYLTDDLSRPTRWRVPAGTVIQPGGFLLFWADEQQGQGPTHTNFKLSRTGEAIALIHTDGVTRIDSIVFGEQATDVSFGRFPDGEEQWLSFQTPTPGASNQWLYSDSILNAASFRRGPVAPAAIVSWFGDNLAPESAQALATPLPTELAGVSLKVADSTGAEHLAPLFYVSPSQVNFLVPEAADAGRATVRAFRDGGVTASAEILVEPVAPGLFAANSDGRGLGAVVAVRVDASDAQTVVPVSFYSAEQQRFVPVAIDLGAPTDRVYLLLFGTGIRGFRDPASIAVTIGGAAVPVLGAAPQAQFVGLDQVNVGPLPRSLAGAGEVSIVLTIDGKTANPVTVTIQSGAGVAQTTPAGALHFFTGQRVPDSTPIEPARRYETHE